MFLCEEKGAMSYAEATMRKSKGSAKKKGTPGASRGQTGGKKMPAWPEVRRATLGRQQLRFTNE